MIHTNKRCYQRYIHDQKVNNLINKDMLTTIFSLWMKLYNMFNFLHAKLFIKLGNTFLPELFLFTITTFPNHVTDK